MMVTPLWSMAQLDGAITRDTSLQVERNRTFDESRIEDFRKKHNYTRDPENANNPISKLFLKMMESLSRVMGSRATSTVINIFLYAIAGLAVILLIYMLARAQYGSLIKSDQSYDTLESTLISPESSLSEVDQLIDSAIQEKRYRDAIRFQYIKSLKLLTTNQAISWNPEMTNAHILRLIKSKEIKSEFIPCVHVYEHVWYGEYPIEDLSDYRKMESIFNQFHSSIKSAA